MAKVKQEVTAKQKKVAKVPAKTKAVGPTLSIEHANIKKNETQKATAKITLTLNLDDLSWLDTLSIAVREETGASLDRGALVRGMLATLRNSTINFKQCRNEKEVSESISKKLRE